MNLLGIDTSTKHAGIALQFDGDRRSATWWSEHNHGVELLPRVIALMTAAGCSTRDLDRIAVALGPGGFSAVRVGVSCAQGLAAPSGGAIDTIGVPTHYLQARCWERRNAPVSPGQAGGSIAPRPACDETGRASAQQRLISVIPVGRDQVSWAEFSLPLTGISTGLMSGIWGQQELRHAAAIGDVALCGEAAWTGDDLGQEEDQGSIDRAPETLLDIALDAPCAGDHGSEGRARLPLHPLYAREPTITRRGD